MSLWIAWYLVLTKTGLKILLIERDNPDNTQGKNYQLPGDLIRNDENLDQAATRVLKELTGLENLFLSQYAAFGNPLRVKRENDLEWLRSVRKAPDARVVTIGYFALIKPEDFAPSASSFARKAEWVSFEEVPELAFDHNQILETGLNALNLKMRSEPIGFKLLPTKFTLNQFQTLYETVMGSSIDKRNFRRKVQTMAFLKPLDEKQKGVAHKPARLYEFNQSDYNHSFSSMFDFQ